MYLNQIRKEHDFLENMNSTARQCAYDGLIQGFSNISKIGTKYPRCKSKKNTVQSYKVKDSVKIIRGKLKLPKMKNTIKIKYSRKINGKIRSATITNNNGKYFVSINVTKSVIKSKKKTSKSVGIDLGIKEVITTSDGYKSGKILLEELDNKIARAHQKLSNRKQSGKNWQKAKTKLNNLYSKKRNIILDKLHKITTKIITEYDKIFVGNIQSKFTLKNKHLAKSTTDSHLFEIKRQLKYKSKWYDKEYKEINEKYTSKNCSTCNHIFDKLKLNTRKWICPICKVEHDRDINVAINIQTVGTTVTAFSKTNNIVSVLGISH